MFLGKEVWSFNDIFSRFSYLLGIPADIGSAGFAGPWEPAPTSPATPTRRLMKRPTAQHGGLRMERQQWMRDNRSVGLIDLFL